MSKNTPLDTIVKFSRRKGFVYQSSEIYGGFAATYDFGPLGSLLRKNLITAWENWMVNYRTDVEQIEGAIFLHPKVWEASGHIGGFSDLLVEDLVTKKRYRADHLVEDAGVVWPIGLSSSSLENKIHNLVFDFDGVIGDTFETALKAHMLLEGISYDEAKAEMLQYCETPSHTKHHSITEEKLAKSNKWLAGLTKNMNQIGFSLFDGFIAEIRKIPNCRMAIVSSGSMDYIKPKLDALDLIFTHVLTFEDHHSKEEKIEKICQDWGIGLDEVYYFTDTKTDVLKLEKSLDKQKIIGCEWGFAGYDKLLEVLPPQQILRKYEDIQKLFGQERSSENETNSQDLILDDVDLNSHTKRYVRAVIYNPNKNAFLFSYFANIKGANKYGLVGGGVENGEELLQALKREIEEETGYTDFEIKQKLGGSIFSARDPEFDKEGVIKQNDAFLVVLNSEEQLQNNFSENELKNGLEMKWVELDKLKEEVVFGGFYKQYQYFLDRSLQVLGLKDYSQLVVDINIPLSRGQGVQAKTNNTSPELLDKDNARLPFNPDLVERAKQMSENMTEAEKKLWFEILSSKKTEYKWVKQKVIDNYIVDFYCSKLLLVIEVDGDTHGKQVEYDQQRTKFLNQFDIQVIRFTNPDILNNIEGVYSVLKKEIETREQLLYPEPSAHPLKGVQGENSQHLEPKENAANSSHNQNIITEAGSFSAEEIDQIIEYYNLKSPDGNPLSKARQFNLMVKTHLGPVEDETSVAYLKGEACQNIYVNWKQVQETTRRKLPFGIAQLGKAFRNEITVKQFMFRTREFEQIDLQYFVKPPEFVNKEAGEMDHFQWYDYWKQQRYDFYTQYLGFNPENVGWRQHTKEELVFYAADAWDVEYRFGALGFKEMEGLHNRTDYDTKQHQQFSGTDLTYLDPTNNQRYLPYIVEMSLGVNRLFLATLFEFYTEEEVESSDGKHETRVIFKAPYMLAPYKLAILPLMKKDGLQEKAQEIYGNLRKQGLSCDYDDAGSIGKRYRRQDENGTPYCVCVDYQTLEDNTVTIRHRDTMQSVRIKLEELSGLNNQRDLLVGKFNLK